MIQFQTIPHLVTAPQIVPCMRSIAERMASDMNEMAFAGETVNVETLKSRGYSAAVVKRLGDNAVAIARRKAVRHIEAA